MKENSNYHKLSLALSDSINEKQKNYLILKQKINEILPILKDEISKYLGYEENDYVNYSFDNYRYIDESIYYDFNIWIGINDSKQYKITTTVLFDYFNSQNKNILSTFTIILGDSKNQNSLFVFTDVKTDLSFKTSSVSAAFFTHDNLKVLSKESFLHFWFAAVDKNIKDFDPWETK